MSRVCPIVRRLLRILPRGLSVAGAIGIVAALHAADTPQLTARPLAPRSGPPGRTMFTLMPPEQTGIVTSNPYDDPGMWADHYREFSLGSMGTGVAIGDYDNDGRPDIFVVSKTGQCRLFRNLGNWKFEDVTEKAGLLENGGGGWLDRARSLVGDSRSAEDLAHWKHGATFVDVNNDGWLDIYVCRFNAPNLLYINQRDGTFKEEAAKRGLAVVDASVVGAFCDYDRDGWLDVYVLTNMLDATGHPEGQRDYLFHNNGDGTFTNVTERAGIAGRTMAHSSIWWDYDGDGWPDLYVTDDFSGADQLYHNNRDGTFTNVLNRVVPHTPDSSMGSDLGDINNDGLVDLMVADMAASTHEKDQRGMAISRGLTKEDDGRPDVPQYQRNALFLNTGTGHMQEAAYLAGFPATDWTWSVRFEDLDNDGRLDLHVTNGMFREYQNADLRQRIMVAEQVDERIRIIRSSPIERDQNFAFRNLGDLRFEDVSAAWGLDQKGVSYGAAFGDLDGDGDLDLVFANYDAGVTVLRNDCQTGHRLVVALHGTKSNRFGIGSLVRIETASGVQVRPLVLMRGYVSSSEPIAHFGLGDDTMVKRLTVEWPSGAVQTFTDIPADQRLTITEPSDASPPLATANGHSASVARGERASPPVVSAPDRVSAEGQTTNPTTAGTLFEDVSVATNLAQRTRENFNEELHPQPLVPVRFNHRGPALAVGELNGDGLPDLLLGGTSLDPARALVSDGAGAFLPSSLAALAPGSTLPDGPMVVFDADGDGYNDVLWTKAGTAQPADSTDYQPRLILGGARGALHVAPSDALPPLPISVGAVAVADFNRDGKLDVFIGGRVEPGRYPLSPRSALLENRGGKFEDVTAALAPGLQRVGMVSSALWSDVDGDGWPDLLVALEWGPVKYFHNDAGRGFSDWTEKAGFASAGSGWWTSLATADFNGDGRPDFVAGNVGLNTQYSASPEHPTLIFYGDFAGNGRPVAVEAYYEGDKLFPRRTRDDLGAQIPSIRQRYRRNDIYARSTLPEILGEESLKRAQRFAASELRSGVFLSQPDGTYRFDPFPRMAQIAPAQGLAVADFDGDGHADIVIAQNSYAPIAWIGHFDGGIGQLLRGDGHGHFAVVPPRESNFVVPGDGKALVVLDLNNDGWPDLVVSQNNASTVAFRNRGVAGHRSLRVDLKGLPGNRTAIGARVTLELSDDSTQSAEIVAGSGYYSQSAPECFFGYPDSVKPTGLTVRWPDGATSAQPISGTPKSLIAQHP